MVGCPKGAGLGGPLPREGLGAPLPREKPFHPAMVLPQTLSLGAPRGWESHGVLGMIPWVWEMPKGQQTPGFIPQHLSVAFIHPHLPPLDQDVWKWSTQGQCTYTHTRRV